MRRTILVALVAAITVLSLGGTAASSVPQVQCQLFQTGDSPSTGLDVGWSSRFTYFVPPAEAGVSGSATVDGHPGWAVFFDNHSSSSVTNPKVTISSGLDPAVFDGEVPSFPFSCSLPSLDPNQELQIFPGLEATGVHSSFSLGYDSARSVSPAEVPVGGGDVTVRFTVKLTDVRYAGGADIGLFLNHGNGVSIISQTSPTNLAQGESASPSPNAVQNPSPNDGVFALSNAQLDKTYVFSALVHVDNPSGEVGAGPWTWVPGAQIYVSGPGPDCAFACNASGSSVSFADPSLDGANPGSGSVSVAVDQSDRHWGGNTNTQYVTSYQDGLYPDLYAEESSSIAGGLPASADTVASGAALMGQRNWAVSVGAGGSVSQSDDPTVSVTSGYDPSLLNPGFWQPATAYPIVFGSDALSSNGGSTNIGSTIDAPFTSPCDVSRTISPLLVPVGGGEQTVTLTVACTGMERADYGININVPGAQVLSFTPPDNLTTEHLFAPSGFPQDGGSNFGMAGLIDGKQYTASWVIQVPNTGTVAFADKPNLDVVVASPLPTSCKGCGGPRTSVTVADPTLDGPTAGAGQVTFGTATAHIWNIGVFTGYGIDLRGTESSNLYTDAVASAADGTEVTFAAYWGGSACCGNGETGTPMTFTVGSQSCTGATGSVTNPTYGDLGANCTITLDQPVGSYTLDISSPGDATVFPTTTSAPFSITGPTSTEQCKNDGWQVYGIFKNQGDCVSYVATGGKNPPAGG